MANVEPIYGEPRGTLYEIARVTPEELERMKDQMGRHVRGEPAWFAIDYKGDVEFFPKPMKPLRLFAAQANEKKGAVDG